VGLSDGDDVINKGLHKGLEHFGRGRSDSGIKIVKMRIQLVSTNVEFRTPARGSRKKIIKESSKKMIDVR